MRAGKLRDLIEIHSYTSAKDDFGQSTKTYSFLKDAWAEALPISGAEIEYGGKYIGRAVYQFTIRYTAINNKNRIVFDSGNYEIFEILPQGGRKVEMKIMAALDE